MSETMKGIKIQVPEFTLEKVTLKSHETALIVIDMQNDFVHPKGSLYLESGREIIPIIRGLLEKARRNNVLIIFTKDSHFEDDIEFKIWPKHTIKGTWGWEIVDELAPKKGEIVIEKLRYDAFFGTPLDHILRIHGIKNVVVTGVVANICVLHTAGSAALRGYNVILPIDAIAAINEFDYYVTIRQVSFLYKGIITKSNLIEFT